MAGNGISLFDGLHQGLERALDLRRSQHILTAGNLANANTPGYRAKELPFDEMLTSEIAAVERGESARDIQARELEPAPWSLDGNSVNAEREAVKLTENTVLYNALAMGASRRLQMLRFAASDGKG
ncbi:MAG: hypothetical protein RLZZ299_125 [Pseudomonadota bacterium]|jgi:flagellar basal-body rod protein FlgB